MGFFFVSTRAIRLTSCFSNRDATSFRELPASESSSPGTMRGGDLATLTAFVVAEALALRACAPGMAHWAQHASAAATAAPLLAWTVAWSLGAVFTRLKRTDSDEKQKEE